MDKIQELFINPKKVIFKHSTGYTELDDSLEGGFPQGRIIDLYGHDGVGKTLIGLDLMKHVCDLDLLGCYIDTNFGVDMKMLEDREICLEKMYFAQPDNGDMALDIILDVLDSGICDVMVIDSTAGFAPDIKSLADETNYKLFMKNAINKISSLADKYNVTVVFLNEFRVGHDGKEMTLGTDYLTFEASIRGEILLQEDGIYLDITKNKVNSSYPKVKLYDRGE